MPSAKREQLIEEAEKLAARGKIDAAIKQYQRAVDSSPGDTTLLNRLGDLLVRADRIPEAIEVYQRIAGRFTDQGFFLKSIAIFKKVNRLDPRRTETYEQLADLYFKQGLVVEGRQQLQTLADWFLRSKQNAEAVRIYRRLVELDPANVQARAKIVDLSLALGNVAGVSSEIEALSRSLLSRGMLDEAVTLHQRVLAVGPDHAEFLAPCIDALVAAGRQRQAVELARQALAIHGGGIELRRAAAHALISAKEVKEAADLLGPVLEEAGERSDVVQLYADVMIAAPTEQCRKETVLPLVDRLTHIHDTARAATLVQKLITGTPGDLDVLDRALLVFEDLNDTFMVVSVGTELAEGHLAAGRRGEGVAIYRRVAAAAPADRGAARRLAELTGEVAAPASEPSPTAEGSVEFVDVDFEPSPRTPPAPAAPAVPAPDAANVSELFAEALVFAKYGLADKAINHLQRLLALDPGHEKGKELLVSLSPALPAARPAPMPPVVPRPATPVAPSAGVPLAPPPMPATPGIPSPPPVPPVPSFDARGIPELDLGTWKPVPVPPRPERALPSFDDLLLAAPGPPLRDERLPAGGETVQLDNLEAILGLTPLQPAPAAAGEVARAAGAPPLPAPAAEPAEVLPAAMEVVEVGGVLAGPDEEQLRELDLFIQQGLLDDGARLLRRLQEAHPDHPDVMARKAMLKTRGWDEAPSPPQEAATAAELFSEEEKFFDLAAELEKELADDELVAEATGSGKGNDVSIEDLFKEFQRGVAEQVEEEDFDTHFNLGVAYREMGLLDEAIGEFQLAVKSPDYLVESASMIGGCYVDKGLPEQAVEWYERALTAPALAAEVEMGLRYELGRANELAGNTGAALACFSEVLAINPAFRDVVARVSKLRSN